MKVTLTLKQGSFYFLKHVHLLRGVPQEVDLTTLEAPELTGIKLQVKGGTILADKDIQDFGATQEIEVAPLEEQKEQEIVTEAETEQEVIIEEAVEEPVQEEEVNYRELSNKQLREKLAELGLEPTSNRKDDLVAQLTEAVAKA